MTRDMNMDYSWDIPSDHYLNIYKKITTIQETHP
jgi:hypothetical protein